MRPRSKTRTCSRNPGKSACRSTGVRNATPSSWSTNVTRTSSSRNGTIPPRRCSSSPELTHERARCHVSRRVLAVGTVLTIVGWVLLLAPKPVAGQAFWAKDTPKLPMAKTWAARKAKLPRYTPPRTPDGVPNLQGAWSGAGGDNNSYLEDHEYVDRKSVV